MSSKVDSGRHPDGQIHLFEAFVHLKALLFGKGTLSEKQAQAVSLLKQNFFSNSPLFETPNTQDRLEVVLASCTDGDTCKMSHFILNENKFPFKIAIRISGIDTAESNPSTKLNSAVKYTSLYLQLTYSVRSDLQQLTQDRIQYIGKLAGAVTDGFRLSSEHISIAPSFTRVTDDPKMCRSLDLIGNYGRLIARLMAGKPDQREDLLVDFIRDDLPQIMAAKGMQLYGEYRTKGNKALLTTLQKHHPEVCETLSPETLPNPSEIFSERNCLILANKWVIFCQKYPEARNDFQTMLAFIGLTPPYPKYRMHLTPLDLKAEAVAMGTLDFPRKDELRLHGLNIDTMYRYLRPNADPDDPNASPVFIMFEQEMSGGKDLTPPDCTEM